SSFILFLFFFMTPPPPRSPLFPYTTLFRSASPRSLHLRPERSASPCLREVCRDPDSPAQRLSSGCRRRESAREAWCRDRCRSDADRKSTRLNSSHSQISYAVFCLKKKKKIQ